MWTGLPYSRFALLAPYEAAVLLGDLNFGDGEQPETGHLARRYVDLWTALHPDLPGYTWDMERSEMARQGAFVLEQSRRLDRILARTPHFVPGSITILGDRPVAGSKVVFPSDHFGLVGVLKKPRGD